MTDFSGFKTVYAGDLIRASVWNAARRLVQTLRIIEGYGVRCRYTPHGTIVSFDGGSANFEHPWKSRFVGYTSAIVNPGMINGVSATIGGIPLEGSRTQGPPVLEFKELKADRDGRGWIAGEVTFDSDWGVKAVEIVQVGSLDSESGEPLPAESSNRAALGGSPTLSGRRARVPLAVIRQRSDIELKIWAVAFHHLQHRVYTVAGSGVGRHFFYAAG